ncbi:MAG: hypothetical protein ACLQDY_23900 [Streptosporangiaceae bacterium]
MPVKTVERASEVSCYRCGSTDIYSVCHHCAKPMCENHSPFPFRVAGKLARDQGTSGKPASQEYGGLKLETPQAAVYHCGEHDHAVNGLGRLVVIGAVIAVIGLIVALFATVPGIVVLLAGVAVAAYGVVKVRQGRAVMATTAPDLPLFPHVRAARVTEYLQGRVDLTESGYRSTVGDITGTVVFSMTHSDWQERMKQYRRKYLIAEGAPVTFNAGFALLQGPVGLNLAAAQPLVLDAGTGLWFRGDVSGHDLFAATAGRHEGEWQPNVTYQLQDGRKPKTIPLWIVPSLVPGSDQRTLQIDLHWTPLSDGRGPVIELFDRIQLAVPVGWGNMENADPGNAATTAPTQGENFRIIDWQQVPPKDPDHNYSQLQERRSRSLTIRFERPIPPQSTLAGRIEATFEGTLSGVTGIGLYLPGGRHAERQLVPSAKTRVMVDFTVSLGAIRYQDDRMVPDENNADDENRSRLDEFAGVVPNYSVIIRLTDAISKDDYYVKSVIEHTPYRDDSRADVLNRVWDIAGRFYTGVFPIDFDIHVRGEEIQGASGASAGKTAVQVTVKGSYATGGNADGRLRESIENKWDDLHSKVMKVLSDSAAMAYAGWTPAEADNTLGQPTAAAVGEVVESVAIEHGSNVEPLAIRSAEIVESEGVTPSAVREDANDKAERKADLRRQWKIADEAVMTGRISENVYRDIVTRIKTELRDLGEDLGE